MPNAKDLVRAILNSDESHFNELAVKDATLDAATFKNAHVSALRIHTIDASKTEWEACIFDGTVFENISLEGAFFNGCSFHNCVFRHVVMTETSFDGCVLHKTQIRSAADLEAAEITNSQFRECDLSDLHFVDSTLESLTFTAGAIRNVSGTAEVKSVALRGVTVEGFDTSEMTVSGCTASACDVVPAGFAASAGRRRRV